MHGPRTSSRTSLAVALLSAEDAEPNAVAFLTPLAEALEYEVGAEKFLALAGFLACPEKTCCAYDMEVIKGYSKLAKKKTETPGPFDNLFLDCICCYPCIYCLIYRELKLTPCGGQKEAPTFSSIDRT